MLTTLDALNAMASGFTIANVSPFGSSLRGKFVVRLVPLGIRPGSPLEVDVTNVVSQLTDADLDLRFIAKNVRFADFDPPTVDALGDVQGGAILGGTPVAAPQILPVGTTFPGLVDPFTEGTVTSPGVPGLIGALAGTFQVPLDVTQTTSVPVQVDVQWRFRDENNQPMSDVEWATGVSSLIRGSGDPPILSGEDALAPLDIEMAILFGELTLPPEPPRPRTVSAAIRLSAGTVATDWVELPPLMLALSVIPVPTAALFFQNKDFTGHLLFVVPPNSPIGEPPLVPFKNALDALNTAVGLLGTAAGVATFFINHVQAIKDAIDDVGAVIFTKKDSIGNLNDIDLDTAFIIGNDTEAEDELSSMIFIGPPRRKIEAFNASNFSDSEGEMEIVVGRELVVFAADLHRASPVSDPPGRISVPHGPAGSRWHTFWWGDIETFGDELSSIRFGWL